FHDDTPFPGLNVGPYNYFSTEAKLFLDLAAGYYRFGVNSDDGFELDLLPRAGVTGPPIVVGVFDNGRAADDTLFDFVAPKAGVYPFDLIYFETAGNASCEFFSVNLTNTTIGEEILINDLSNPNAIKSFITPAPIFTSIVRSGGNVV